MASGTAAPGESDGESRPTQSAYAVTARSRATPELHPIRTESMLRLSLGDEGRARPAR